MKLLRVDFSEIQKAIEDVERDAFDYFLDLETGDVISISVEALEKAEADLCRDADELREYDMPEWVEKEIELAIMIFSEKGRYERIPERQSRETYSLMKEFVDAIEELKPHDKLSDAIIGKGAFGRFKKVLADYPGYRERWFAFNAGAMKKIIAGWLESIGIKPEHNYYQ